MEKMHLVILVVVVSLLVLMFGLVSWQDAQVVNVGSSNVLSNAPMFFVGFLIVVVVSVLVMVIIGDKF